MTEYQGDLVAVRWPVDLKRSVQAFEDKIIDAAMRAAQGNKNAASKLLGMNRTTLVEKLRKRGLIQKKTSMGCGTG